MSIDFQFVMKHSEFFREATNRFVDPQVEPVFSTQVQPHDADINARQWNKNEQKEKDGFGVVV